MRLVKPTEIPALTANVQVNDKTLGFTLLEVMVALAILAIALTVVSQAQQLSARRVVRAKLMTLATLLARQKLTDLEEELREDGFSDFESEKVGDFSEEGFPRVEYKALIERIELPEKVDADAALDALQGSGDELSPPAGGDSNSEVSGAARAGAQLMETQFKMFREALTEAIRRVKLNVFWYEGGGKRSVSVTTYFTDVNELDRSIGGAANLLNAQVPGQENTDSSGTNNNSQTGEQNTGTNNQ